MGKKLVLNVLHNTLKKRFKDKCVKVRIIVKIVSKEREVAVLNCGRRLQDTVIGRLDFIKKNAGIYWQF